MFNLEFGMTFTGFIVYNIFFIGFLIALTFAVKYAFVAATTEGRQYFFKTIPMTAWFGMVVLSLYIFVIIFADVLAPLAETDTTSDSDLWWGDPNEEHGFTHIFGTDELGRDIFSRMIYAARNTVLVALLTTILAFAIGIVMGLLAVVHGGWIDQLFSRFVDVLMSIPQLIFALLLLTLFPPKDAPVSLLVQGDINLILVIAVLDSTRVFRLSRAVGMNIVVLDYVEAAKLRGESTWWIVTREILPAIKSPLIAEFGLRFCFVFLTISALSFLGIGFDAKVADWGGMVKEMSILITDGISTPLLPAEAIALLTISVNFIVDWMLHRSAGLKD